MVFSAFFLMSGIQIYTAPTVSQHHMKNVCYETGFLFIYYIRALHYRRYIKNRKNFKIFFKKVPDYRLCNAFCNALFSIMITSNT